MAIGPPALNKNKSYSLQPCLPLAATINNAGQSKVFFIETHPLFLIVRPYADSSELSYSQKIQGVLITRIFKSMIASFINKFIKLFGNNKIFSLLTCISLRLDLQNSALLIKYNNALKGDHTSLKL